MQLQDFDARSVQPQQPSGMGSHPPGMHEFQVTNTWLAPSENNNHLMLHIEFTTPVGRHVERFIVAGISEKAIEIANKQIAMICHATNIYKLSYPKDGNGNPIFDQAARELRGARGRFEIGFQKGHEPSAERPNGGYVEVKKYYDVNGNEPGKQGSAPQPQQASQQPTQQPMQQQPGGGWGNQQPTQNPAPQSNNNPAPQQWGGNTQPQQQPQGGGWSPQGGNAAPAQNPPWGK